MRKTNINALIKMTKDYLDGKIDRLDYVMDFPYEFDKRYSKMCKEDSEYADLIYYYLIEKGTNCSDGLSDDKFYELTQENYLEVLDGVY